MGVLLVAGVFGVLGYAMTSPLNGSRFPADVSKVELLPKPLMFNIIWSFALAVIIGGVINFIKSRYSALF